MTIMSDIWIKKNSINGMISPFCDTLNTKDTISYGLSSYGYDARIASQFKLFTNINNSKIDPKNFSYKNCENYISDKPFEIAPYGFVLGVTVEHFVIPEDIMVICLGKSTYARCGLIINVTPLEAGWQGKVTIEISNTAPNPVVIYPNEGICQFIFFATNEKCNISYKDRNGKYMNQQNITLPKV